MADSSLLILHISKPECVTLVLSLHGGASDSYVDFALEVLVVWVIQVAMFYMDFGGFKELGADLDDRFRVVGQPNRPLASLQHFKGCANGVGTDLSAHGRRISGGLLVSPSDTFFVPVGEAREHTVVSAGKRSAEDIDEFIEISKYSAKRNDL
ncbi:hypothetical protein ACLOJK_023625 [Asimina triloba]